MVFEDDFGENPTWVIKLEDLTKSDIRQVVEDRFNAHPQFGKLIKSDPGYEQLVDQVVGLSQGVFLWVHLVVRDLLDGLTYNDSIKTLRARLESFPKDLDSFFKHMLDSIPEIYQARASRMFKIAISGDKPLYLIFYSLLEEVEENESMTLDEPVYGMPRREIDRRRRRLRRHLDGRSRGLLEIVSDEAVSHIYFRYKVDFLHRTVRDFFRESGMPFLRGSGTQVLGQEGPKTDADIQILACKAALAMMRRAPADVYQPAESWEKMFELFFSCCIKASEYPNTLNQLRDLISRAEHAFDLMRVFRSLGLPSFLVLGYACQQNVLFYLEWKLAETWFYERNAMLNDGLYPVLDFALSRSQRPCARTVDLLLRYGANPNQVYEDSTVWRRFLERLPKIYTDETSGGKQELFQITRQLLLNGANLNGPVKPREGTKGLVTACDVIKQCFPADEATVLLAPRPGWFGAITTGFW